jgi:hypothetical protein
VRSIELFGFVNWGELQVPAPGEPFRAMQNCLSAIFDVFGNESSGSAGVVAAAMGTVVYRLRTRSFQFACDVCRHATIRCSHGGFPCLVLVDSWSGPQRCY